MAELPALLVLDGGKNPERAVRARAEDLDALPARVRERRRMRPEEKPNETGRVSPPKRATSNCGGL